jgi:hypothetical protein
MSAPLLRDLIDIPEKVFAGDFVLRLSEGVANAEETLQNYVVTPQLAQCFDEALGVIGGAITGGKSAASYLHGSFGPARATSWRC